MRQEMILAYLNIIHDDFTCNGGTQRKLVMNFFGFEAGHAFFEQKAANGIVMCLRFCPDDKDIGNWSMGNPDFRTGYPIALVDFFRDGFHARRV